MIVYKYVMPARIEVLQSGLIRFTQAVALNDPFEVYPNFTEFNNSLDQRARKRHDQLRGGVDAITDFKISLKIPEMVKGHTSKFLHELRTEYLILSLSEEKNNLLMWSHYADSHRGFVIGFDSTHPFFNQEKPRTMTRLEKVNYSANRLVVPTLEECMREDLQERIYITTFLTKSDRWAYEHELRMVAQPKAADKIIKVDGGADIYLYKFPSHCLKEVIMGHLMPDALKDEIANIVTTQYPDAELYVTLLNETKFDLDVVPYKSRT